MKTLALLALLSAFLLAPKAQAQGHEHDPMSQHVAVFFEIPVVNFDRAVAFYETVMGVKLGINRQADFAMAFFPAAEGAVTGALISMAEARPGADGPVIYLNGGEDLQVALDRVVPAGGIVLIPKTLITAEIGYFAYFLDTEGNRLGLFSSK